MVQLLKIFDTALLIALSVASLLSGSALIFSLCSLGAEGSVIPEIEATRTLKDTTLHSMNADFTEITPAADNALEPRGHGFGCWAAEPGTLTDYESSWLAQRYRNADVNRFGNFTGLRTMYMQSFKWESPEDCWEHCRSCFVEAASRGYDALVCYTISGMAQCKAGYTAGLKFLPPMCPPKPTTLPGDIASHVGESDHCLPDGSVYEDLIDKHGNQPDHMTWIEPAGHW